jgi:hypothetical protein
MKAHVVIAALMMWGAPLSALGQIDRLDKNDSSRRQAVFDMVEKPSQNLIAHCTSSFHAYFSSPDVSAVTRASLRAVSDTCLNAANALGNESIEQTTPEQSNAYALQSARCLILASMTEVLGVRPPPELVGRMDSILNVVNRVLGTSTNIDIRTYARALQGEAESMRSAFASWDMTKWKMAK